MSAARDLPIENLRADQQALIAAALAATTRGYAPYSGFQVGAALQLADGAPITGANFENVSYGLSLCAETVALASANSAGRLPALTAIAVAATGELRGGKAPETVPTTGRFIAPCGRCRQILAEAVMICGHDIDVLLLSRDERTVRLTSASALLPLAFGAD